MDIYYQMKIEMELILILNSTKLVKYRQEVKQLISPKMRIMCLDNKKLLNIK